MITKRAAYAYPTSEIASRLGRRREGCWFVELCVGHDTNDWQREGPFTSATEAHHAAEDFYPSITWCPMYLRYRTPA